MRYERYPTTDPAFLTPLICSIEGGRNFIVVKEFDYHTAVPLASGANVVEVVPDFLTDLASVPRILWNIFPPNGKYGKAAVVHDFLYRNKGLCTKAQADNVFFEAMGVLKVNRPAKWILYTAVHLFGGSSYKGGL